MSVYQGTNYHGTPESKPTKESGRYDLKVLVKKREGESFQEFVKRAIEVFKKAGILKQDGSSNLPH
jgi:hypothetical protein